MLAVHLFLWWAEKGDVFLVGLPLARVPQVLLLLCGGGLPSSLGHKEAGVATVSLPVLLLTYL